MEIKIQVNHGVDCNDQVKFQENDLSKARDIKVLIQQAIKEMEAAGNANGKLRGVPSGFSELDRLTSGWRKGELILIAARPGMGKTTFANSLALNAALEGLPIAIFSLEISAVQLTFRLISSQAEIYGEKLRKGLLKEDEWNDLNRKIKNLEDAPIFIDDTSVPTIIQITKKSYRLVLEQNIQLIIIDNLQQIYNNNAQGNNKQDLVNIICSLKALAEKLDIPIIVMSQLSKTVETRGGLMKPKLSDLNEFGAIHQLANMVLFIYRPEYYDFIVNEMGESLRGKAEIIMAKNRNGSLDSIWLKFIGSYLKFKNCND